MGLFDEVLCDDPRICCSEGHDLRLELLQTKDLGESMGRWTIYEGKLDGEGGGYGSVERPFLGRIRIYTSCRQCPAFVQAGTSNLCDCPVAFSVEFIDDHVRDIRRVSPSTAEWLKSEPAETWMVGCLGPMPWAEAQELHVANLGFGKRGSR